MGMLLTKVLFLCLVVFAVGLVGIAFGWITSWVSSKKVRLTIYIVLTGGWIAWGVYCLVYSRGLFEVILNLLGFVVPAFLYVASSESFIKEREYNKLHK